MRIRMRIREDYIEALKAMTSEIAERADEIVGTIDGMKGMQITIYLNNGEIPSYNIDKDYIPLPLYQPKEGGGK